MIVYVVTNVESGWDCVMGVFKSKESAVAYCCEGSDIEPSEWEMKGYESSYIIHSKQLE